MSELARHPDLAPLAFLLGTWSGEGRGEYSTIESFGYWEETRFWHVGKPFLSYTQRTISLDDGRPLHAETGYWRPVGESGVEVVIAHPMGVTEVQHGTVRGSQISLSSIGIGLTPTAKSVEHLDRTYDAHGDTMTTTLAMAALGLALEGHLSAELHRQPER